MRKTRDRERITPAQIREARRLLGFTQRYVAELAGLPTWSVKQFEAEGHLKFAFYASEDRVSTMRRVLEAAGIEFFDGQDGPGVRVRKQIRRE